MYAFCDVIFYIFVSSIFILYLPQTSFKISLINNTILAFFWLLISYVIGLYDSSFVILNNYQVKRILFSTFRGLLFFCGYLFINLLNINIYIKEQIFFILILTILSETFYFFIIKYKKNTSNIWILVGTNSIREKLNLKYQITKTNYKFILIKDYLFNTKNKITTIEGIIIDNEEFEKSGFSIEQIQKISQKIISLKSFCDKYLQRYPVELINDLDFLTLNPTTTYLFQLRLKRIGDIVLSMILLIFLILIILVSAIFIYLEDQGPIFYSQIRNGYMKRKIKIWKLRTMKVNAESSGPKWSKGNDNRITRVGSLLRKLRIDELPQLWNVFIGEMTLIGPRPERPEFDEILESKIPFYGIRYKVKPGLSGWAQVNYPYGSSIRDSANKLSFDIYYLRNFNFFLDITILVKTIRLVLNSTGAIKR